nr:hypothetical protein [Tanacetum cinerariifolium]
PAAIIAAAPSKVAAAPSRRRKRVVIRDPKKESTTSSIIPANTKSKDKGKGVMAEEPKPLKKKQQDVAIDHVKQKAKEDPALQRYQVLKKKPQTEAQARKNIIMYLKNGRIIDELDKDDDVALMDDKEEDKKEEEGKVVKDDQVQGRQAESQAKIYKIDLDHALKVLKVVTAASEIVIATSTTISTAEPQVPAAIITAAPSKVAAAPSRRRKRV